MGKNIRKWVNGFMELNPDYQLEIAEAIIEELDLNEASFDEEDNYDSKKSKIVREFLDCFIIQSMEKRELKKVKQVLEKYDTLSSDKKEIVIGELLEIIDEQAKIQDNENKKAICQKEGHIYGEWKYHQWKTHEEGMIDHQWSAWTETHEEWRRKCSRCGYQYVS